MIFGIYFLIGALFATVLDNSEGYHDEDKWIINFVFWPVYLVIWPFKIVRFMIGAVCEVFSKRNN